MKKIFIMLSLVIMASLIFAGCQGAGSKITDTVWEWEKFQSMDDSEVIVDDPENYTLILNKDGSVSIKADCNAVLGEYTIEDASLKITLGPTTLAFCGEDSLDTQYLGYLENVATYVLEDGKLYLNLWADAGNMIFVSGGKG
jgi:heat shock protein HslJ